MSISLPHRGGGFCRDGSSLPEHTERRQGWDGRGLISAPHTLDLQLHQSSKRFPQHSFGPNMKCNAQHDGIIGIMELQTELQNWQQNLFLNLEYHRIYHYLIDILFLGKRGNAWDHQCDTSWTLCTQIMQACWCDDPRKRQSQQKNTNNNKTPKDTRYLPPHTAPNNFQKISVLGDML